MPTKRPQFANGEIYHIVLRGIARQKTFLENRDYLRYLLDLYKFNDKDAVFNISDYFKKLKETTRDGFPSSFVSLVSSNRSKDSRNLLIEILAISLIPNHIHLLVRQLVDNGISLFFQKMGGYSSYFNKKYDRFGSLFQRPFKAIHIKSNDQLLIVVTYIHMNATDLIEPGWKEKGIHNPKKVMEFLENYPWSSYGHYLNKKDFSGLINSDFLNKVFGGPDGFRSAMKNRVFEKSDLDNFLEESKRFALE